MPKQTTAQAIGREGERWFSSSLPSTWLLQPPLEDVGVDGVVVICETGPLNGAEFRVQVKSSRRWQIVNDRVRIRGLKWDTFLYWLIGFTPTLLVAFENSTRRGYCDWANKLAFVDRRLPRKRSETFSVHIPTGREIGPAIWPLIRHELALMQSLIGRRVQVAGKALPILRSLHILTQSLRGFDWAANPVEPMTDDHVNFLRRLEITAHRDVVRAVRSLDHDLRDAGYEIEGLADFAGDYATKCATIIPQFLAMLEDPDLISVADVDVRALETRRAGFVRSVMQLNHQLTGIGLQIVPDEPMPVL